MSSETWARVSLRIVGQRLTVQEIEQLMGSAGSAKLESGWATDLTDDSAAELHEQLQIAKAAADARSARTMAASRRSVVRSQRGPRLDSITCRMGSNTE